MLTAVHSIEDRPETLEGARLAAERDDVPLEERYDPLAEDDGRRRSHTRELVGSRFWELCVRGRRSSVQARESAVRSRVDTGRILDQRSTQNGTSDDS